MFFWHTSINVAKPNILVLPSTRVLFNPWSCLLNKFIFSKISVNNSQMLYHVRLAGTSFQACHLKSHLEHHLGSWIFSSNSHLGATLRQCEVEVSHGLHFHKIAWRDAHILMAFIHYIFECGTSLRTGVIFVDTKFSMNNTVHKKHYWIIIFHHF